MQPIHRHLIAFAYGLLCHGLFIVGVGMMIYQMYHGMQRSFGTVPSPMTWFANGILLIQFPLAHSFLLSRPGRRLLSRVAPISLGLDLLPTTYVIIASAQVLILFACWTPSGSIWWQAPGAIGWLLTSIYAASWLLLGKAIWDAGFALQTGSLGWLAVYRNVRPQYPGMPTQGLFRLCRQPIYFAFTCTVWTVPVWSPDQLVIALALTSYCLIGPLLKEARFQRLFGQTFASYRSTHSYWLPMPQRPLRKRRMRNDLSIYDASAAEWWSGSQRWIRTLQNLVPARFEYFDRVANWAGTDVLDLGCGGGFMSEALAQRGANVTGIDPAERALAMARSHAAAQGLTIRYLKGSGERLPLPDNCMDYVVCVDVLEHVNDVEQVVSEVRRVLRPGGVFLFDTINRTPLAALVIVFFGEQVFRILPAGSHDPAKFIRPAELAARLAAMNFNVSEFIGLGPRGIDRKFDFVFGTLQFTSIMYLGHATLAGSKTSRNPTAAFRRMA